MAAMRPQAAPALSSATRDSARDATGNRQSNRQTRARSGETLRETFLYWIIGGAEARPPVLQPGAEPFPELVQRGLRFRRQRHWRGPGLDPSRRQRGLNGHRCGESLDVREKLMQPGVQPFGFGLVMPRDGPVERQQQLR